MATMSFSLAEAHGKSKKYDCSDTCAEEMRAIDGYEEDCYHYLSMIESGSARYLSKIPKQYKYICRGIVDFVNACYCLAPDKPTSCTSEECEPTTTTTDTVFIKQTTTTTTTEPAETETTTTTEPTTSTEPTTTTETDSTTTTETEFEPTTTTETTTTTEPTTTTETTTEPTTTTETDSTTTTTTETTTEPTTTTETDSTTTTETDSTTTTTTTTETDSTTTTTTTTTTDAASATCPASCNSGFQCSDGTITYCDSNENCICFGTTEGDSICLPNFNCPNTEQCTSSNDCTFGQRCVSNTCCNLNVCVTPSTTQQCQGGNSEQSNLMARAPAGRRARGNTATF
ncbi:hypothetical protein ACHAPD_010404 [Fusarium lateritium]